MVSVHLGDLVRELGGVSSLGAAAGPEIKDAHLDSRRVEPGALFAALPGLAQHGAEHAGRACARGAVAVLSDEPLDAPVPTWVHPRARRAFGEAAAIVHGRPSERLFVVAITGTNGKTTTAHIAGQLFEAVGRKPAVLGTTGYRLAGGVVRPATHTTPDAGELQRLCAEHERRGGDVAVLEASSHALEQERCAGLAIDVAIFTNLSPDHLDHHGDMETYAAAKQRLFERLGPGATAVVRVDDPVSARMASVARARGARVVTYGAGSRADLSAERCEVFPGGTHFILSGMGVSTRRVRLPLLGRFNVENALAALAAVLLSGASPSRALEGLAAASSAPGRLEPVATGGAGFTCLVDFAHSEDALRNVLGVARTLAAPAGRLICVFGCGGERDRSKRAPMGRAVGELADLAVLTSDNPRGEDPGAIAADVLAGLAPAARAFEVELDRRRAIALALGRARPGDVVLIAGKGHEALQESAGQKLPFDDRAVAREVLGEVPG